MVKPALGHDSLTFLPPSGCVFPSRDFFPLIGFQMPSSVQQGRCPEPMWQFLVEIVLPQESVQQDIDHARSFRRIK